jgi:hypothetical protein
VLGQHRFHLGLEAGADVHQLGPIANQLPQLPKVRRGDPGLGELVKTHPVDELAAVLVVVLHPPALPGLTEARGVDQMHGGAQVLQHVHGPVPAVGGLDGHLGVRPGVDKGLGQCDGAVVDALDRELGAGLVLPHDQRPGQVQIHCGVLSVHRSSPCSKSRWFGDLECFARAIAGGRGPTFRPGGGHREPPAVGCGRRLFAESVSESEAIALSCHHLSVAASTGSHVRNGPYRG